MTATPDPAAPAATDHAARTAELPNPAVYLELAFGTAMHAKIWISPDAPDAFHTILDFARGMHPDTGALPLPRGASTASRRIKTLIDAGLLTPGQKLTWHRRNRGEVHEATVTADARLRLADGSVHATASAAASHLAGYPVKGPDVFATATGDTLADLTAALPAAPNSPGNSGA